MISIKGFAIVPKKLNLSGDKYYGEHTNCPIQEIYNSKDEAEEALKINRKCYFDTSNFYVKEVEVIIN